MKKHFKGISPATCEGLEARLLLNGTVTATVLKNGDLTITGDKGDNVINVHQTGPSSFDVDGMDGTTVVMKGDFDSITGNITIDLKKGDNTVFFNAEEVSGSLSVTTSSDDDFIDIDTHEVHGNVTIVTGSGNDDVDIDGDDSVIEGNLSITGNSQVMKEKAKKGVKESSTYTQSDEFDVWSTTVVGNTTINTGSGTDWITVDDNEFLGTFTANTGAEDDEIDLGEHSDARLDDGGNGNLFVGAVNVNMGNSNDDGDNFDARYSNFIGPVNVTMGTGAKLSEAFGASSKAASTGYQGNEFDIRDCSFSALFSLTTGKGDDDIAVKFYGDKTYSGAPGNAFAGGLTMDTGAGCDDIDIYGGDGDFYILGPVNVNLGAGEDWVDIDNVYVHAAYGTVDGGADTNYYDDLGFDDIIEGAWVIKGEWVHDAP